MAIFFLKEVRSNNLYIYDYYIHYFDYDLKDKVEYEFYRTESDYYNLSPGNGVYFKALYLKDDTVIFLFYISYNNPYLKLSVKKYNSSNKNFDQNILSYDKDFCFNRDVILNDFFKIDDTHLVHITSKNDYKS